MPKKELVDLRMIIKHKTGAAYLVAPETDQSREIWLPRSQVECERDAMHPHIFIVTMPEWLAIEKELV